MIKYELFTYLLLHSSFVLVSSIFVPEKKEDLDRWIEEIDISYREKRESEREKEKKREIYNYTR